MGATLVAANRQDERMIIISAMSENRVIGNGDGMPWNVPEEYDQYLQFVTGNTVIMGRRTYEIFGTDLPASTTAIVVTRNTNLPGVTTASSLNSALEMASRFETTVFVAGGGSIYERALPLAAEMYLSFIKGHFQGDTYFPEFCDDDWKIIEEREEPEFLFRRYQRQTTAT
jgi:dihydrofolate reductase